MSGPTISRRERAKRGYGNRLFSLSNKTSDAIGALAQHHECTRSDVVAMAVERLQTSSGATIEKPKRKAGR